MNIKFNISADNLQRALDVTSIVVPRQVTPKDDKGYLFVVRGDECHIYSRSQYEMAKAVVPITDVVGDSPTAEAKGDAPAEYAFVVPLPVDPFRYLEGTISFEASSENDSHILRYAGTGGAAAEKGTFDYRLIPPFDKELKEATDDRSFPVGILRDAVALAKPFVAEPKEDSIEEFKKIVQIFDDSREEWAKGKNQLYASNGTTAFFFHTLAFEKGLAIHSKYVPLLISFLAKTSGRVIFKTGKNLTFAIDSHQNVFGWPHATATHPKFGSYGLSYDKNVFEVSKPDMMRSLMYTKMEIGKRHRKTRLLWSNSERLLKLHMADASGKVNGYPITADVIESEGNDFSCGINIDQMIDLFQETRSNKVQLRISILPPDANRPKGATFIRTLDNFVVDEDGKTLVVDSKNPNNRPANSYDCRVIRFMPSKD